jgi:decaprenylphospho-beta-D-erythro-pentofuranosid-2-ulose 2-reductase
MRDGLGRVGTVLLVGGSSEIGLAVADRLLPDRSGALVLAGRPSPVRDAAVHRQGAAAPRRVFALDHGASDGPEEAEKLLTRAQDLVGDLDVVLMAVGSLRDESAHPWDATATQALLQTNLVGPALVCQAAAATLAGQGHGRLVVLSSAAAARPRDRTLAYGSAKRGLDAFAAGLHRRLEGTGAGVLVVRPGHVRSRMTAGLPVPPLATTPARVAAAVDAALQADCSLVWVPRILPLVLRGLQLVPRSLLPGDLR